MVGNKPAQLSLPYGRCPVTQHPEVQLIHCQLEAEMTGRSTPGEGGEADISWAGVESGEGANE